MTTAKTLNRLMSNLTYVAIDREKARGHWLTMCEAVQRVYDEPDHLASHFYMDNFTQMARQKALAGILGHKTRSRGWFVYRFKERRVIERRFDR